MNNEEDIKRWTAKRKSSLVANIIQGKTTLCEFVEPIDLTALEIENWVDNDKRTMENALRTKPEDLREQTNANCASCTKPPGRPC